MPENAVYVYLFKTNDSDIPMPIPPVQDVGVAGARSDISASLGTSSFQVQNQNRYGRE